MKLDINHLLRMANSRVMNYAIPGLNSSLIGGNGYGLVRLFECSRDHQESIVPHSHRFDFHCLVLQGSVKNKVWTGQYPTCDCDMFMQSRLTYKGNFGEFEIDDLGYRKFDTFESIYVEGDTYSMKADEIHSIFFARGTKVLMFESPTVSDSSVILQPYIDGKTIPTFKVDDWMFERCGQ